MGEQSAGGDLRRTELGHDAEHNSIWIEVPLREMRSCSHWSRTLQSRRSQCFVGVVWALIRQYSLALARWVFGYTQRGCGRRYTVKSNRDMVSSWTTAEPSGIRTTSWRALTRGGPVRCGATGSHFIRACMPFRFPVTSTVPGSRTVAGRVVHACETGKRMESTAER